MTVQKTTVKNVYVGNGATTDFPITFDISDNHPEYIKVYITGDDGKAIATTNFQSDVQGKKIVYPKNGSPLPTGQKITIYRELSLLQLMELVNQGSFFADNIELAFDDLTCMCQQLNEKTNRALSASVDVTNFNNEIQIVAGKGFRIKDDGTGLETTEDPARVLPQAVSVLEQTKEAKDIAVSAKEMAVNAAEDAAQFAVENVSVLLDSKVAAAEQSKNIANVAASSASESMQSALSSKEAAAISESNARESFIQSQVNATTAIDSATAANISENNAKASEINAEISKVQAMESANESSQSKLVAVESANAAASSENIANEHKIEAALSASQAAESAQLSATTAAAAVEKIDTFANAALADMDSLANAALKDIDDTANAALTDIAANVQKAQTQANRAKTEADRAEENANKAVGVKSVNGIAPDINGNVEVDDSELQAHIANENNPHKVTAAQLGLASAYKYKSSAKTYADLPISGNEVGDVWNVEQASPDHGIKDGDNVAWTGAEWDVLAGFVDTSELLSKTGGTMSGSLILQGNPALDYEAANKKYIDDLFTNFNPADIASHATAIAKLQSFHNNTMEETVLFDAYATPALFTSNIEFSEPYTNFDYMTIEFALDTTQAGVDKEEGFTFYNCNHVAAFLNKLKLEGKTVIGFPVGIHTFYWRMNVQTSTTSKWLMYDYGSASPVRVIGYKLKGTGITNSSAVDVTEIQEKISSMLTADNHLILPSGLEIW